MNKTSNQYKMESLKIETKYKRKNRKEKDECLNNNKNNKKIAIIIIIIIILEEQIKEGLENGTIFQGTLRVNQRNTEQCFVDNPEGEGHNELLILGAKDRNRALHGDLVAVKLKSKEFWFLHEAYRAKYKLSSRFPFAKYHQISDVEDCCNIVPEKHLIKSAQVVAVLEKIANRRVVGHIKPMLSSTAHFLFLPSDSRVPRILIPIKRAPTGFYSRPQDFEKFLYLAQLTDWEEDCINPRGKLLDNLGEGGEIGAEHKALLRINYIDEREYESFKDVIDPLKKYLKKVGVKFGKKVKENKSEKEKLEGDNKKEGNLTHSDLEVVVDWEIHPDEFAYRRDFRNETIFTIDPLTARDLDDALHIKRVKTANGQNCWEVGVHIADVSYFLPKDLEASKWACSRGTTVYLVHKAIPMLPSMLCENLCSLNPGEERLTFSIVWTMDDDANILSKWIGRSIIRSCTKLAYEHAQEIIENPRKQFAGEELPKVHFGIKIRHIKESVLNLYSITKKLKARRFERGGLKFDLPKLRFDLEKSLGETGNLTEEWRPRGLRLEQRKDSNFLVEELMLLANMEVAKRLHEHFKDRAMLRRHPYPKKKELKNMIEKCFKLGIKLDPTSSKSLGESIEEFNKIEQYAYTIAPALNQLLIKCMYWAQYFCTGEVDGPSDFYHYGLGVDFYTHFTSPIRRYPDIIVHRLLAASLKYTPDPIYSVNELKGIASRANTTKACAKMCFENSCDIFFGAFLKQNGGLTAVGIVMAIFDECFDVLLIKYGIVRRVYLKKQTFLERIYHGKLTKNGPITLVLWLNEQVNNKEKIDEDENCKEIVIVEGIEESEVEEEKGKENKGEEGKDDDEIFGEVPEWLRNLKLEEKQTLNCMSVVRIRLNNIKNTVKYEANLIPTPDSSPLSWIDAKQHMDE
ncbi:RNB domain-containing protein [Meloidogyne graminicola]|uniref:RNB domain-containing protein n=1 Tax=Meloidogyne graminicola TaxID=189291 RepID=A0A8T0A3G1_9BILA|nr:RNB domain-containing protein [Meloidogyne graminicola]